VSGLLKRMIYTCLDKLSYKSLQIEHLPSDELHIKCHIYYQQYLQTSSGAIQSHNQSAITQF